MWMSLTTQSTISTPSSTTSTLCSFFQSPTTINTNYSTKHDSGTEDISSCWRTRLLADFPHQIAEEMIGESTVFYVGPPLSSTWNTPDFPARIKRSAYLIIMVLPPLLVEYDGDLFAENVAALLERIMITHRGEITVILATDSQLRAYRYQWTKSVPRLLPVVLDSRAVEYVMEYDRDDINGWIFYWL